MNITGSKRSWPSIKTISFESCDTCNPGELKITGRNYGKNTWENCIWGGLLLHCTAIDFANPCHNFVSNKDDWKDTNGNDICSNNGGMMRYFGFLPMIKYMKKNGAEKIWIASNSAILIGKPKSNCKI